MRLWIASGRASTSLKWAKSPSRQARLGFSDEMSCEATSENRAPFCDSETRS